MIDQHLLDGESQHTQAAPRVLPERCVIVVHKDLSVGHAANAAAVVALTLGQRHPALVGEPFVEVRTPRFDSNRRHRAVSAGE
jgi:hypothetical protein